MYIANLGRYSDFFIAPGGAVSGGADTVSNRNEYIISLIASLDCIIRANAMALCLEVQKKGQAEIDAVVGPNRLPDFHDRPSLPYINAVVKETSRWNLASPLGRLFVIIFVVTILTSSEGVPHMCTIDDEYNGFYIPKGTTMIGNVWLVRPP